jgi:transcriptional regulator with XRE-family HTH domain
MDIRLRLAKNLKRYRLLIAMSQEEVAHRAHLERAYVSGIERGVRNPTVAVLQELASVLGVHEADLIQTPLDQANSPVRRSRRKAGG